MLLSGVLLRKGVGNFIFIAVTFLTTFPACCADSPPLSHTVELTPYGQLPVSFEPNRGQADSRIRYLSQGFGPRLSFSTERITIGVASADALSLSFVNSASRPRIDAADQLPGRVNYFRGSAPSKWITEVPTYATVKYAGIYPGIDVRFHGTGQEFEYDLYVAAGADPRQVRIRWEGVEKLRMASNGDLIIQHNGALTRQHAPHAFQEKDGIRRTVQVGTKIYGNDEIGFELSGYDPRKALVIDPAVDYSAHIGDAGAAAYALTVNPAGEVFLTGTAGSGDVFVMKLDSAGTTVLYTSFLGLGASHGIAVTPGGNAAVVGFTKDTNFPVTAGAFQSTLNPASCGPDLCGDTFVSVLSSDGSVLSYSTFLGSSGVDHGQAVAADSAGAVYLTGDAGIADFPTTPGALQTTFISGSHVFVSKIDSTKSGNASLPYSTFLGGAEDQFPSGMGIAVDVAGNAFVAGLTASDSMATAGAFQDTNPIGSVTGFIAKLNHTGSSLIFSTYLGGTPWDITFDWINAIAIDSSGNSYVTGIAAKLDFPTTPGAFQTKHRGWDAFVTKLNPQGSALVYSTLLGGGASEPRYPYSPSYWEQGWGIAVDPSGNAYVGGRTPSADFPTTPDALELVCHHLNPNGDVECDGGFFTVLNPTGTALIFSTFFGADLAMDVPPPPPLLAGLARDASGKIYLGGSASAGIPIVGGPPTAGDAWVARIDLNGIAASVALVPSSLSFEGVPVGTTSEPQIATLTNTGNAALAIINIALSAEFAQTNDCPASLNAGAHCTFSITFTPQSQEQGMGDLTVTDDAFDSPHYIVLPFSAGTPADTVIPSSLTFADQEVGSTSTSQPVTLSNTGTSYISIMSIVASGDFAQTNNCGDKVPVGHSCQIDVTFTPSDLGSRSGTLVVSDNTSNSPHTVLLGGTGIPSTLKLGLPPNGTDTKTVTAGSPAEYTLVIGGGGLSGTATLNCSGAPDTVTCTVPDSVPVDANTPSSFNVTVTTTAPSHAMSTPRRRLNGWFLAMTVMGFALFSPRKKRVGRRFLALFPFLLLLGIASCGGGGKGSSSTGGNTGTPTGTYTVTVKATMGNTVQSTDLKLIVK